MTAYRLSSLPVDLAAFTDSLRPLPLGKKANAEAAKKLREEMGEMIEDVGMEVEEEDEEMKEWEKAQIRRAGGERRREEPIGTGGKKGYRPAPSTFSFSFTCPRGSLR